MRSSLTDSAILLTTLTCAAAGCDLHPTPTAPQPPPCSGISIEDGTFVYSMAGIASKDMIVGDSVQLYVYLMHPGSEQTSIYGGTYRDCIDDNLPVTVGLTWSSDNSLVATVHDGLVKAIRPGSANVEVVRNISDSTQSTSILVTVSAPVP